MNVPIAFFLTGFVTLGVSVICAAAAASPRATLRAAHRAAVAGWVFLALTVVLFQASIWTAALL